MRKPLRDSWVAWRIKVTKELDEYTPEDLSELKSKVQRLEEQVALLTQSVQTNTNNITDIDNTFNGLFTVMDFGAISANNNLDPILKEQ